MRPALLPALAILAALPAPAPASAAAPPAPLAVRAARLLLADGRTLADAVVIVKEGRVAALGAGLPVPQGARVLDAPVAVPGLVDLWTRTPGGNDSEDPRPFAPALRAADGIDPRDRPAAAAAREGVLLRVVLPSERNPLGGRAAVARVADRTGRLEVAGTDAGGAVSLADSAVRRDRYPGSFAGLLRAVDSAFDLVEGAKPPFGGGDPSLGLGEADLEALRSLRGGGSPAWIVARSRAEVRAALRLAGERRLRAVLVDPRCGAATVLEAAKAANVDPADLSVVLALDLDDPLVHLRAAGALAAAGVRVGFGGGGPGRGPDALRRAAALAARHGLGPEAARGALLGRGFELPGRSPGGLAEGEFADLVLLDGDPADPSSRVLSVIAGGEILRRTASGTSSND